jgi:hypothetical protein
MELREDGEGVNSRGVDTTSSCTTGPQGKGTDWLATTRITSRGGGCHGTYSSINTCVVLKVNSYLARFFQKKNQKNHQRQIEICIRRSVAEAERVFL